MSILNHIVQIVQMITRIKTVKVIAKPKNIVQTGLNIDNTSPVSLPNLLGASALGLSIKQALPSNTTLINLIRDLNLNSWTFISDATTKIHHVKTGGDGYNFVPQEVLDRGQDPCKAGKSAGGMCTSPCITTSCNPVHYGRDFFNEFVTASSMLAIPKVIMDFNLCAPLSPYSTATTVGNIDWSNINIGALNTEVSYATAQFSSVGITPYAYQFGLELVIPATKDLLDNPGGSEHGEGVYKKLLTTTNAGAPTSIITHSRTTAPSTLVSSDLVDWLTGVGAYPNWNSTMCVTDLGGGQYIDVGRQYYQLYYVNYLDGLAKIAQFPQFFGYITGSDFNGKGVIVSQMGALVLDNSLPPQPSGTAHTVADGLLFAQAYMTLTKENTNNGNKVKTITQYNIRNMINLNTNSPYPAYYFMKQLGQLFGIGDQMLSVTSSNVNLVILPIKNGSAYKIGVINNTSTAYQFTDLNLNGSPVLSYTCNQLYSNGDVMGNSFSTINEANTLNFRPYSFSLINF